MRNLLLIVVLLTAIGGLIGLVTPHPQADRLEADAAADWQAEQATTADKFADTVGRVDAHFRREWAARGLAAAGPAEPEIVVRRLNLALVGTVPSLQELRRFEQMSAKPADAAATLAAATSAAATSAAATPAAATSAAATPAAATSAAARPDRIQAWLSVLLADRRFADYFAERWTRAYVGVEDGPFLIYRRRRLRLWLSDQFLANRRYDEITRELISAHGVWTDTPAVNFISATIQPDEGRGPDPERLAGRVARTFLGQQLDCARCHDHPFARWKQNDFHGLAAFFGQVRNGGAGIFDAPTGEYQRDDRPGSEVVKLTVAPAVPFAKECLPPLGSTNAGTLRQQLAGWVTDPRNPRLALATVNRTWAILFGRPLAEPVDDIPDAPPEVLRVLAEDFAAHGYDMHRLLRIIVATEAFRLDSRADFEITDAHDRYWAVFPETRLRPEQVAGSVLQAACLTTIDAEASLVRRLIRTTQENDFVKRYGDLGEDEFGERSATIPQQLLLMNGNFVTERTREDLINAARQIALLAPDDAVAVETAFRAVLTRRPTEAELAHFTDRLRYSRGQERGRRLADLYWSLINTTEFSWNH